MKNNVHVDLQPDMSISGLFIHTLKNYVMKHRIYERMLHETYTKLNKGLEYIHDVWGHGCPLGMEPITYEELEYDRKTSPYDKDGFRIIIPPREIFLKRFLYDDRESYIKHLTSIGKWPIQ